MPHTNTLGYFGPHSATWLLYREPLVLLGGIRALLLQVAHPSVADGVARFSQFQSDPFGRGYRTFAAMAQIYFGSSTQAEQTAQHLSRMHSGIRGGIPQTYSANQPDLLLWVLATLTDTTLWVYGQMPMAGLPPDWRVRFYEESKVAARLLGIPEEVYPPDLAAFEAYFQGMLSGGLLGGHPVCQEVAQAILRHPRTPTKMALRLAAGGLPPVLCQRLGIEADVHSEARLSRFLKRFFRVYRLIPKALRWNPAYHQAQYRVARAAGKPTSLTGRFFHWLSKRMAIPMGLPHARFF